MAVKFGIRNYSRVGNQVNFTVVALNADGSIDTGYTGSFAFTAINMSDPGPYNFVAGDAGQRSFTSTVSDPTANAVLLAEFPGSFLQGAVLGISGSVGGNISAGYAGDNLFVGGVGADRFGSTIGNDLFLLQQGGDDLANGDAGNDGFYFGAAYSPADSVNGGAGSDQVALQGNYAGTTLAQMSGVEMIVLLPGDDNRFGGATGTNLSYNLTVANSITTDNNLLTIQANTLRAGENFIFNGGGSSSQSYIVYGGLGTDILTGGAGNDGFFFGQGRFSAGDRVDGGAGGTLDQLGLQGNYSIDFTQAGFAGAISNIDFLVLLSAADTRFGANGAEYDYSITWDGDLLAAGQRLIVSANSLGSEESIAFNGSDETNGQFTLYGGFGNDVLTGGSGADLIYGGGRGDTLTGGAGNDIFAYTALNESNSTERDGIQDFNAGDRIDLSRIDANTLLAGNQDFDFIGSAGFSNAAGQLRFENVSLGGPIWLIQADADGDGVSDFEVVLVISPPDPITASDFIGVNQPAQGAEPLTAIAPPKFDAEYRHDTWHEVRHDRLDLAVSPTHDLTI